MILIAAVDDNYGMMFNNRRQSQDRVIRERILELAADRCLWMDSYSRKLFGEIPDKPKIKTDEDFLEKAPSGDYCFLENHSVSTCENKVEKIILFKWNRRYPSDFYFDLNLKQGWRLTSSEEFAGYSHEKITMEVYVR